MNRILLVIALLAACKDGPSQETAQISSGEAGWMENFYLQLIYHDGIFWSRTEYLDEKFENGYKALEARFGLQTTGKEIWQQLHLYPRYGFGLHYADLVADRTDKTVGNPFSVFVFYGAPWIRTGRFSFNSDLSLGLSYTSLIHDPLTNPYNDVIASHFNLYFDFNLNVYLAVTDRISLNAGYGVTHNSNGRIHQPQKGLNCWGWNAGISFHPTRGQKQERGFAKNEKSRFINSDKPEFFPEEELQVMYGAGTVEHHNLGDLDGVRYFTSSFTIDYAVRFNHRMAFTLGTDILYDGSLELAVKGIQPENVTTCQKMYFGGHLGYHFLIDRVTILGNLGTYLLQHSYDRGSWFIRAGGRVRLTHQLHTQICLKTKNGARADWIEWGIVTAFRTRRNP